jgi:hypothetical protein
MARGERAHLAGAEEQHRAAAEPAEDLARQLDGGEIDTAWRAISVTVRTR